MRILQKPGYRALRDGGALSRADGHRASRPGDHIGAVHGFTGERYRARVWRVRGGPTDSPLFIDGTVALVAAADGGARPPAIILHTDPASGRSCASSPGWRDPHLSRAAVAFSTVTEETACPSFMAIMLTCS